MYILTFIIEKNSKNLTLFISFIFLFKIHIYFYLLSFLNKLPYNENNKYYFCDDEIF